MAEESLTKQYCTIIDKPEAKSQSQLNPKEKREFGLWVVTKIS